VRTHKKFIKLSTHFSASNETLGLWVQSRNKTAVTTVQIWAAIFSMGERSLETSWQTEDSLVYHDNAPAHIVLSVQHFMAKKKMAGSPTSLPLPLWTLLPATSSCFHR
jgi:hypothetical protein